MKSLIDTDLIGAERAAALKDQDGLQGRLPNATAPRTWVPLASHGTVESVIAFIEDFLIAIALPVRGTPLAQSRLRSTFSISFCLRTTRWRNGRTQVRSGNGSSPASRW